jgi:predicted ferric reductase
MPDALDLSNFAGLGAIGLLTLNILLGLLIKTKYNPVRRWPHRRINTVQLHNWTGYLALALALVHPVLILFSASAKFGLAEKRMSTGSSICSCRSARRGSRLSIRSGPSRCIC